MNDSSKKTYGLRHDATLAQMSLLSSACGHSKWRLFYALLLACICMYLLSVPAEAASTAQAHGEHQLSALAADEAEDASTFDAADNWNYPNENYFKCVELKNASAPLRYSDFSPISATGGYLVLNSWRYDKRPNLDKGYCATGQVRLDAREVLQTSQGRLYFHKGGGEGYAHGRVPYGHLWIGDIRSGTAPSPQVPTSRPPEYGAPSAIPGTDNWDWERRNGRGCTPTGAHNYRIHITRQDNPAEAIPESWLYKKNMPTTRYNKYADAGAEQSEGTEHYGYLMWSWVHEGDGRTRSRGGGMVRSLTREGQPFYRCPVTSINSIAYDANSGKQVGRVRAIYGKTRASAEGPWVYGWIIHSHKANNGPWIYHVTTCPSTGC